jgi:hypothetical protein
MIFVSKNRMLPLVALLTLGTQKVLAALEYIGVEKRAAAINANLGRTYQTIDRFGFSEAFG